MIEAQETLFGPASDAALNAGLIVNGEENWGRGQRHVARREKKGAQRLRKAVETLLPMPREGQSLTLLMVRFFIILLANAQEGEPSQDGYFHLPLKTLLRQAEYNSNNNEHAAEVLRNLVGVTVNWGDNPKALTHAGARWNASSLLSYVSLETMPDGTVQVIYDMHNEVKKFMLDPKVYVKLSVEICSKLSTLPALTLYQVMMKYATNKNGLTGNWPWEYWWAGLTGKNVADLKTQYKYFYRDVLAPALREINTLGLPYYMEALPTKEGRKVTQLQFKVIPKALTKDIDAQVGATLDDEKVALVLRLMALKVDQEPAERLIRGLSAYKGDTLLRRLEERAANKELEPVQSILAYARAMLDDISGLAPSEKENSNASAQSEVTDLQSKDIARTQASLEAEAAHDAYLLRLYLDALRDTLVADFKAQAPERQLEVLLSFEAQWLPKWSDLLKKKWAEYRSSWPHKPMSPFIAVEFSRWLCKDAEAAVHKEEVDAWALQRGLFPHVVGAPVGA